MNRVLFDKNIRIVYNNLNTNNFLFDKNIQYIKS
jgi:hypothetical protein